MRLGISEILSRADKLPTEQEKVAFLQANYSVPLVSVLKNILDPSVVFLLPEGAPPYKPNPYPGQELRLYAENRRLYIFIEGQSPNINRVRREQLFIEILEAVSPQDAQLLIAMKDKQMPYASITCELANQAFPGLIPNLNEDLDEAPIERQEPVRQPEAPAASPTENEGSQGARRGQSRAKSAKKPAVIQNDEGHGQSAAQ